MVLLFGAPDPSAPPCIRTVFTLHGVVFAFLDHGLRTRAHRTYLAGEAAPLLSINLEKGTSQPRRAALDILRRAFEAAGVEFIDESRREAAGVE